MPPSTVIPCRAASNGRVEIAPDPHVSPLDSRLYRALTLANGVDVLLVSDFASDRAAAALNVSVGSFSDPEELPGLAHFLEHMLFLGTEKFPEEGSFDNFLSENGGQSNAYTAAENTNYHFDMIISHRNPNHPSPRFHEALDRFAQFFTAPLFTESATERELNAVHSEHQQNLQSDGCRMDQVKSANANRLHPISKFCTGSRETLWDIPRDSGIDTRSCLLQFYHKYYSANLMNLCIVAPYPLDLLQKWTVDIFSTIPNHNRENPYEEYKSIKPYLDKQCGLIYHVETVCHVPTIEITWITESYIHDYESKPGYLLSVLIGDEGQGSLLSLLKKCGWCDELTAGSMSMQTFGSFYVSMTLTNEGIEHIDEIIATTYQYIKMLKNEGISKRIYDEEAGLSEIQFRFRDREGPISLVMRVSSSMRNLPTTDYLSGYCLLKKFDEEKITDLLNHITPDKCNIMIAGKSHKCKLDKTEKFYKTRYRVEQIDRERLKQWQECDIHPDLRIPPLNEFIPSDFTIVGEAMPDGERDAEGPKLIEKNEHFELRHKLDRTFMRPWVNIVLKLMTPMVYHSPWHSAMATLLTILLEDSLTEFSYPADCAGFTYSFDKTEEGFYLFVNGYSHRIDRLLYAVARKIATFQADEKSFQIQKDFMLRSYLNLDKRQPHQEADSNVNYLLQHPCWNFRDYLPLLQNDKITLAGLNAFAKDALRRLWVKSIVCGNISSTKAISIIRGVQETLGYEPLPKAELVFPRIVQLPVGQDVFLRKQHPNEDDNNSAIEVRFQLGPRGNLENDVKMDLLSEILSKPAFHELRTVQQLGYIVCGGVYENEGICGIYITVQSTVADPDVLLQRIDEFLETVRRTVLAEMTEEKFGDYVKALEAMNAEPDRTIGRQARRFWAEIDIGFLMFDRRSKEIEVLQSVRKEDVVQLFDEAIAVGGHRRKRVVSQVFGNQHRFENRQPVGEHAIEVEDPVEFRSSCPLYAVVGRPW